MPTIAASGVAGYDVTSVYSIFAPAKTSAGIINRLNQEIMKAIFQPDTKQKLFASGVEVDVVAEEFGGHGGALDVPAGAAAA